jgi:hypothetical protein
MKPAEVVLNFLSKLEAKMSKLVPRADTSMPDPENSRGLGSILRNYIFVEKF